MRDASWIAVGGATLMVALLGLVMRFRRRRAAGSESDAVLAAHRAIRLSADERRSRGRGSIRGQGYGGGDNRAYDAGFTSDSGGTP